MAEFAPVHPLELDEARGWVGHKLDEVGGTNAGRVEGVFVDSEGGAPAWLLVRLGRLGRRTVVPFELAAGGVDHVWVPYPKELIKAAPQVDPARGLDRGEELALCDHYGLPPQAPRRAALEDRTEDGPTAVPAA